MTEKKIHLSELKDNYIERHGFVFAGNIQSSDRAIYNLAETIKESSFSSELPEFYTRLSNNLVAFVYPEGVHFESGVFYHISKRLEILNQFRVEILRFFLTNMIDNTQQ
jgi:hypothetical protein